MRRRNRKQHIAISEAELVGMTNDLEDAHHESLPSMRDSLPSGASPTTSARASTTWCRRRRAGARSSSGVAR